MINICTVSALVLCYILVLIALALWADKPYRGQQQPFIYRLALGVHCSSWASKADMALSLINKLYGIERTIKHASHEERLAVRQAKSMPILNTLQVWLTTNKRVLAKLPGSGRNTRYGVLLPNSNQEPVYGQTQNGNKFDI